MTYPTYHISHELLWLNKSPSTHDPITIQLPYNHPKITIESPWLNHHQSLFFFVGELHPLYRSAFRSAFRSGPHNPFSSLISGRSSSQSCRSRGSHRWMAGFHHRKIHEHPSINGWWVLGVPPFSLLESDLRKEPGSSRSFLGTGDSWWLGGPSRTFETTVAMDP